jgi:large subunit ribosomal protein L33
MFLRISNESVLGFACAPLSFDGKSIYRSSSMAKDIRPVITLECTVCHEHNYTTTKNRRNTEERLEISKYCKRCKKHTPHKETK